MPATETKHPKHCHYCGLPAGSAPFEPEPGRFYCCYGCYLVQGILGERNEEGIAAGLLARLGVGTFLSMTVMMVSFVLYTDAPRTLSAEVIRALGWALFVFSTPAMLVMGPPFLRGAWQELRHGRLNMDALIAVGSFSAYGVSALHVLQGRGLLYFDTATMLLVLVTIGKLLEASAKSNASRVVRGLLALGSRVAHRLGDSGEEEVPPEALRVGDRVAVRPGEQVPVDGIVLSGSSAVQEAAFTGESLPRTCAPGDPVYGGSVNADGLLVVRATGVGEEALLGQMARLVREAQTRRAPVERLADRLSALFVPVVWVTAAGAAAYWGLVRGDPGKGAVAALSVMIVACPCALGLATPLAVSIAIAVAARVGVLIRSGTALELLPRVRRVFLDKTGTLTRGVMSLAEVRLLAEGESEESVLAWAASLEAASEHPVARALVGAARGRGLPLGEVEGFRAHPGQGAAGVVTLAGQARTVVAGTAAFLAERGMDPHPPAASPAGAGQGELSAGREANGPVPMGSGFQPPTLPHSATAGSGEHGLIYVGWGGRARAAFRLADSPREGAAAVVGDLSRLGVCPTLLSGDREEIARRFAAGVGIEDARGVCSPPEKVAAIERARGAGERVAMVGDGINDAPALAAADVGIALAGGTDLAREAGDVVLLGDDLRRIPWCIALARRTYRIIAQNLFWAFAYNAVALAAAFMGRLHPLLAAILMLFSSLFVLGNSLRLLREGELPSG